MSTIGDRPKQVKARKQRFLDEFRHMPNVSAACRAAGITRSMPYRWAAADPKFKEAWDEAEQEGIDRLEHAAFTRAVDGWDEFNMTPRGEGYVVRKYDSALTALLLKAHRPDKYNPKQQVEHSGGVTIQGLLSDLAEDQS